MTCTYSLGAVELNRNVCAVLDENSDADSLSVDGFDGIDGTPASLVEPEAGSSIKRGRQRRQKLLFIGDDLDLLNTRAMVFSSVGYDVTSLSSGEALASRPFAQSDDLVICHSIPETKAVLLATLMRSARPNAHVIRLSLFPCAESASFTSVCGTMHSPIDFVADVDAILGERV